jgi:hypothetical protein
MVDQSVNGFCYEFCMKFLNILCGQNAVYTIEAGGTCNNQYINWGIVMKIMENNYKITI